MEQVARWAVLVAGGTIALPAVLPATGRRAVASAAAARAHPWRCRARRADGMAGGGGDRGETEVSREGAQGSGCPTLVMAEVEVSYEASPPTVRSFTPVVTARGQRQGGGRGRLKRRPCRGGPTRATPRWRGRRPGQGRCGARGSRAALRARGLVPGGTFASIPRVPPLPPGSFPCRPHPPRQAWAPRSGWRPPGRSRGAAQCSPPAPCLQQRGGCEQGTKGDVSKGRVQVRGWSAQGVGGAGERCEHGQRRQPCRHEATQASTVLPWECRERAGLRLPPGTVHGSALSTAATTAACLPSTHAVRGAVAAAPCQDALVPQRGIRSPDSTSGTVPVRVTFRPGTSSL